MNPPNFFPAYHGRILDLHRQGLSQTRIASVLGLSRRTVYNHLHQRVFQPGKMRGRPRGSRKLLPYRALLEEKLQAYPPRSISVLFQDLRMQGYTGGLSILREFCRSRQDYAQKSHSQASFVLQ